MASGKLIDIKSQSLPPLDVLHFNEAEREEGKGRLVWPKQESGRKNRKNLLKTPRKKNQIESKQEKCIMWNTQNS